MFTRGDRRARAIIAVLTCTALLSLAHTIDHDFLTGGEHHEHGDAADSKITLVLEVAGGLLGLAALAVGGLLLLPRVRVLTAPAPASAVLRRISGPAMARAGPSTTVLLAVDRR